MRAYRPGIYSRNGSGERDCAWWETGGAVGIFLTAEGPFSSPSPRQPRDERGSRSRFGWDRAASAGAPPPAPPRSFLAERGEFDRVGRRFAEPRSGPHAQPPPAVLGEVGEVYEPGGGVPLAPHRPKRHRSSPLSARSLRGEGPGEGPYVAAPESGTSTRSSQRHWAQWTVCGCFIRPNSWKSCSVPHLGQAPRSERRVRCSR
jgi:hypothetical protein